MISMKCPNPEQDKHTKETQYLFAQHLLSTIPNPHIYGHGSNNKTGGAQTLHRHTQELSSRQPNPAISPGCNKPSPATIWRFPPKLPSWARRAPPQYGKASAQLNQCRMNQSRLTGGSVPQKWSGFTPQWDTPLNQGLIKLRLTGTRQRVALKHVRCANPVVGAFRALVFN